MSFTHISVKHWLARLYSNVTQETAVESGLHTVLHHALPQLVLASPLGHRLVDLCAVLVQPEHCCLGPHLHGPHPVVRSLAARNHVAGRIPCHKPTTMAAKWPM